ncbi:MAG: three-Cys-motif partner protein TcmP [Treponema sp.]|jgi:three-Cys-motif partner protein|nr:three-Cys-motif partner protein TcmP [Treponema sp.]
MPKDINSEEYDAGTKLKLDILSDYVDEWLQVVINNFPGTIYLYDFFAGSGTDSEGSPGSPIIMLNNLIKNCSKITNKNKKIEIVFNDIDKSKIEKLKTKCQSLIEECAKSKHCHLDSKNHCPNLTLNFHSIDFKILFYDECEKIHRISNPYCFMFIDQYGIKGVNIDVFKKLSSLVRTDVLFFTATAHAVRFSKNTDFKKYLSFDDDFEWAEKTHRELCNHYASFIPAESSFHVAPFSIKKNDTGMIYGLIFGSNHLYGIEKFLSVAWKKDKHTGEANYDIDDDDIRPDDLTLFDDLYKPKKLDRFKKNLMEHLYDERTNKEIYEFTVLNGFLPTHTNQILKDMEKDKKLIIRTVDENARKGAYYINHNDDERIRIKYEYHKD